MLLQHRSRWLHQTLINLKHIPALNAGSSNLAWKAPPPQAPAQGHVEAGPSDNSAPEKRNYITKKIDSSQQIFDQGKSDETLINTALGYYGKKEFLKALGLLDKFTATFPQSPLMDRAAYLRAECLYEVKRYAPVLETGGDRRLH